MNAPTVDDILSWSKVDFNVLGYETEDKMQVLLDRAIAYMLEATGRTLETLPESYDLAMQEGIQRTVEQSAVRSQEDSVETGADFDTIASMNVTGYSENRRAVDDYRKAQMCNPWPLLHDIIWKLATPDRRDDWRDYWAGATRIPAMEVSEIDWNDSALPPTYLSPGA